jgi:hypothetical protein
MTPLEVALIAKKMREAQKQWPSHPQQVSIVVAALEKEFDDAMDAAMAVEWAVRGIKEAEG